MKIELLLPIKDVYVTQPWGVNWVRPGFYKNLGLPLDKHNGIDFLTQDGCPVIAAHDGYVGYAGKDRYGGINIKLFRTRYGRSYFTVYYHLKKTKVKTGDNVKAGELLGWADNTGMSTGHHLHFGLKECADIMTVNCNNGYKGAIDPSPYFIDKNWMLKPVDKYYGRKRNWHAEWLMRFKNTWLHRQLIKRRRHPLSLTGQEVNALIYGAWDFETVMDPAMHFNWKYLTKAEYQKGEKPFK